MGKLKAIPAHL